MGLVAVAAAIGVAAAVLGVVRRESLRVLVVPVVLAAGFVATGSGPVALLGAALVEVAQRGFAARHEDRTDDRSTGQPAIADC